MKYLYCLLFVALASFANGLPTTREASGSAVVDLGYAKYQGVRLDAGVNQYLGMRFAQPPLDDLRWRAPRDPRRAEDVQDASQFGPICIGTGETPSSNTSEDCLFVNVFTPSDATSKSKLPVWLYIQGGGYATNSNNNYNGTEVVQQSGGNIVFVNFNYRVGALGFLAGEKVSDDGDLNVGLLDQRKLLHWLQKHIGEFGGDPSRVVIHGTSAGAGSVAHHMAAYGGRDDHLFVGAVPQSSFWPPQTPVSEREWQFDRFVSETGCADSPNPMDCLRGVDLATIAAANTVYAYPGAASDDPLPNWNWLPVVDGDFIQGSLYEQFERGDFVRVPMLVPNTNDEGSGFASDAATEDDFRVFLKNNFPHLGKDELDDIVRAYPKMAPVAEHQAWFPSASGAYGDSTFTCPGNRLADSIAKYLSPSQVWRYRFNVQDPEYVAEGSGVPHAIDSSAIFGVGYAGSYPPSFATTNAAIVPVTMDYYISFVRSLDPNEHRADSAPEWKPWGSGDGERLRIETDATEMESVPKQLVKKCHLWQSLAESMRL